jgi:hypothetical protein
LPEIIVEAKRLEIKTEEIVEYLTGLEGGENK